MLLNEVCFLPKPGDSRPADAALLRTLGQLWLSGVEVDWAGFYAQERRRPTWSNPCARS